MKSIEEAYNDLFKPYPHQQRDKQLIKRNYKEYIPAINEAVEKGYIISDQEIFWWVADESVLDEKRIDKSVQKEKLKRC